VELLVDFLKNAGLLDLLVILVTLILILTAVFKLVFFRRLRSMRRLLVISPVPLILGLVAMYVRNRMLDRGIGMFGGFSNTAIALGRRDALLIACFGAIGTLVMTSIALIGLTLEKRLAT
jgi:hypothetical protein